MEQSDKAQQTQERPHEEHSSKEDLEMKRLENLRVQREQRWKTWDQEKVFEDRLPKHPHDQEQPREPDGDGNVKTPIQLLRDSCAEYNVYPRNLVGYRISQQSAHAYLERLLVEETRLFAEKPKLNVLNAFDEHKYFDRTEAKSLSELKALLPTTSDGILSSSNPRCRFFFIQADNSRAPLRISRDMLAYICSYYEIHPSFLDFVFPFGTKEHDEHNDVCVLRDDSRLSPKQRGLDLVDLGRSGRDIRLSYHLQSVEPSPRQLPLPWSIRQTAVYHSYDIVTEKALWINVKGNQELENKIDAEPMVTHELDSTETSTFSTTLATHMIFAEWAAQGWHAYINDLSDSVWQATKRTQFIPIHQSSSTFNIRSQRSTMIASDRRQNTTSTLISGQEPKKQPPEQPPVAVSHFSNTSARSEESRFLDDFSFSDLQEVQSTEESIVEVITVLLNDIETLRALRHFYEDFVTTFAADITKMDKEEAWIFKTQIKTIENTLNKHADRSKDVLKKIQERKMLLNSILQYRSMKASEFFASKAQQSSNTMEILTKEMHGIALATKRETVSMHVITVTTLVFLPATFVATFLSTDILQWTDDHRQFTPEALTTYLAISLPLTAITLSTWYLFSKFNLRKEAAAMKYGYFGHVPERKVRVPRKWKDLESSETAA